MTGKHAEFKERAELLASLEAAEASLARGEGLPITRESMEALACAVMERNHHRFPAEQPAGQTMHAKIAAGVQSLRDGKGTDGESFMEAMDAELAALERQGDRPAEPKVVVAPSAL